MTLKDWLASGWLIEHRSDRVEITGFLALAERDLQDARTADLSADWRFNIAYNAALQLANAALAAAGYRVGRGGSHHHHAIQSLAHTLGLDASTLRLLDLFRKKRNMAEYDAAGMVSDQEAREMLDLAVGIREAFVAWLRREHPELAGDAD
jgi:hypothetical protein